MRIQLTTLVCTEPNKTRVNFLYLDTPMLNVEQSRVCKTKHRHTHTIEKDSDGNQSILRNCSTTQPAFLTPPHSHIVRS